MASPTDRIDHETGYILVKLGGKAALTFDGALAPLGLKGRHVRVLEALASRGLSQSELCRRTGLDRTTMVAVVDELQQSGHVRRDRGAADRRTQVVTRTDAGTLAYHDAVTRLRKAQDQLLSPLSPAERECLHALVARLFAPDEAPCRPGT